MYIYSGNYKALFLSKCSKFWTKCTRLFLNWAERVSTMLQFSKGTGWDDVRLGTTCEAYREQWKRRDININVYIVVKHSSGINVMSCHGSRDVRLIKIPFGLGEMIKAWKSDRKRPVTLNSKINNRGFIKHTNKQTHKHARAYTFRVQNLFPSQT